jgi:hypothetical protein
VRQARDDQVDWTRLNPLRRTQPHAATRANEAADADSSRRSAPGATAAADDAGTLWPLL